MDATRAVKSPKHEIKLADYQSPAFFVTDVLLTFKVFEHYVEVHATSKVVRANFAHKNITLDGGRYMTLLSVSRGGTALANDQYEVNDTALVVFDVPDAFELTIVTKIAPLENTRLEGLFASGGNLCTQCEPEGFRHITYFLDRPDVLAVYSVRIEANKSAFPILLSNGDKVDEGNIDSERHFACWHDPHPKPSYLFALVAGDLCAYSDHYVTKSGRKVALNIYVRKPDLDKCDYAMQSLKRSMKWDEDIYGLEYDLDIYNIVAVSDFNMGAMENKGLNIFNTKYVLANKQTATDIDFDNIEAVIGHEYFHNWTGNRVTCRDWFQLSLKEGLTVFRDQEFSSDMTSRAVKRIADVRGLRLMQFPEDAGPLAHSIRPESYVEINNFYTATIYNKGAEVIRMMQTLLGGMPFNEGVRTYLQRFDGQAATCEDFVKTMEDVSGVDLRQFRLWYNQAGTPTVQIKRLHNSNGGVTLSITQSCAATAGQPNKKPFHMPILVAWYDADGRAVTPSIAGDVKVNENTYVLELKDEQQDFVFSGVPKDALPSLHRGFSAPVILKTDLSDAERSFLLRHDTDPYARWQAGQDLYAHYILAQAAGVSDEKNGSFTRMSNAFRDILDQRSMDYSFAAELVSLPSEIYLGQLQTNFTPDTLHIAREALIEALVAANSQLIFERYDSLKAESKGDAQNAKAARRLRNALLGYIVKDTQHVEDAKKLLLDQYNNADNMTDELAALTMICHSSYTEREDILSHFYAKWRHDDLVMDKWFSSQALSIRADTLECVVHLLDHADFSYKNPNRLRSVVSTFSMANQVRFHAIDGSGYRLLSDVIIKVDQTNPQTAAKMIAPLCRWERLDEQRQDQMIARLKELAALTSLSDDVRELVVKALPSK